jgi:hypothetical protein
MGVMLVAVGLCGCTIERSRALGQDCLQDRECVEGLSCLPRSDGQTVCLPLPDGGIFTPTDVQPMPDTGGGTGDSGNTPTDASEMDTSMMLDVETDTSVPQDMGVDVTMDLGTDLGPIEMDTGVDSATDVLIDTGTDTFIAMDIVDAINAEDVTPIVDEGLLTDAGADVIDPTDSGIPDEDAET